MSLPGHGRAPLALEGGGEVGYIDLGHAVLIVPGGVKRLRKQLLDGVTSADWHESRAGFGDPELANE